MGVASSGGEGCGREGGAGGHRVQVVVQTRGDWWRLEKEVIIWTGGDRKNYCALLIPSFEVIEKRD